MITSLKEDGDTLLFNISNINVSYVNGIRRTITSDIPCAIFKTFPYDESDCIITKNTTRFNNEILKHRLGCIPIMINPANIPVQNLTVKVKRVNTSTEIEYVTTKDFKIYNEATGDFLPESIRDAMFPSNPISKSYIDFVRLRPGYTNNENKSASIIGEELEFECKLSIGSAKVNSMFNVASCVSFTNTIVPQEELSTHFEKYINKLKSDDNYDEGELEAAERDWYNLNAHRYFVEDSFQFKLTSLNIYPCKDLVNIACGVLINKIKILASQEADTNYNLSYEINKNNSYSKYCFDINLINESYTIGKIIEHTIYQKCVLEDKTISFVSFLKEHPHKSDSLIRVIFVEDMSSGDLIAILNECFSVIIKNLETIKLSFN
tara:strand:- start:4831 stop:5964 length:1134 start_codon:yes stop_codon:yes gene_type:complete